MPTKDRLEDIDEEIVRYLLHKYLKEVNSVSVLWILPYVYELSIVLICKEAGLTTVNDKYCSDKYDGWRLLLRARNMCSHNIYNAEDIKEILELLMNKRVLFDILRDVGESVSLYLQLHYSIVFLLRKENIYE